MARTSNGDMIVGLDIGTSKVVAIVGQLLPDGGIKVIGYGSSIPSRGLKKGVVVDIESTVQSIQRAIEQADLIAGCQIHSVYASISGSHIGSRNSHFAVVIGEGEVSQLDIDRVVNAATAPAAVAIAADQRLLHVIPQEYIIDGQDGVRDPLGMSGVRLEAKVHLITCAENAAQNLEKCMRRCGLGIESLVLEQLAAAHAVLTDDEKELGVCVVDVGGGTTGLAIFTGGAIRHTAVIPIAGDHITNDIAMALRTPTPWAEDIKLKYACALTQLAQPHEKINVPSVGDRPPTELSRQALAGMVESRYHELFTLVHDEIRRSGYEELIPSGIVLTGGSVKMEGAIYLAEEIFHMPVRLGYPQGVVGVTDEIAGNPIFATSVGLLHYARKMQADGRREMKGKRGDGEGLIDKLSNWWKGNF